MFRSHLIVSFFLLLLRQITFPRFGDFEKEIDKWSLPGARTLGDEKIISGLKEALIVGTENTVKRTGNTGGFLKNKGIKILLPEKLQSMGKTLRLAGFGPQIDELVVSMNRAAKKPAPLAKPIFKNAVTNMSFDEVKKIMVYLTWKRQGAKSE
ncbi:MAG: hypothetical protein NPIRA03_35090 [Nitrospirales bacterium]|nr:MAG: hypothetical protein NPIRA03_35090 [Nitrospirales bacterium]